MARQLRIEFNGGLYHILSRGNYRQAIFRDDNDREMFLDILEDASARFSIVIYAYVLMENHYHLLLKTQQPNLSKTMQWIGSTYTRRFNLKHKESGHLFQGRFKSIIIENVNYLLKLSYYIHRNPLRAGIVKKLADYQWSSYIAYAYSSQKILKQKWLKTNYILSKFTAKDKNRSYRLKTQRYSDENKKIWEDVKHGLILGSERFIEKIKTKFLKDNPDNELPQHNQLKRDISINHIVKQAAVVLKCKPTEIKRLKYIGAEKKESRDMLIFYLRQNLNLNNQTIGEIFGLTYSTISRIVTILRKKVSRNQFLLKHYNKVMSNYKV